MRRIVFVVLGIAAVSIAAVLLTWNRWHAAGIEAAPPPAAAVDTEEIIEARRVLMLQIERFMKPLDEFTVDEKGDLPALQSGAAAIEAMILAFPHLFPPETNLYDPTVRESPTSALPAIWQDDKTFQQLAHTAERSAAAIASARDAAAVRAEARVLRATCDGCHARFMKAYTPPKATKEDLEFDFDSVFEGK